MRWETYMISRIDHIVLTVKNIETTLDFYKRVLKMEEVTFQETRKALKFGNQKINLHLQGSEIPPVAASPGPGTQDICFVTDVPIDALLRHLKSEGVEILQGPVQRTGAMGPMTSVYFFDPDENLIEVSNYPHGGSL